MGGDGSTPIEEAAADYKRLYRLLLGGALEVRAGKRPLDAERIAPYVWRVPTDGKPGIEVRYSLPLVYGEQPGIAGRDEYDYHYVEEDHGLLATGALWVAPNHGKVSMNSIRFVLPEGWQVLAPWPSDADGVFFPGEALWNDLVAVGARDVREISVGDFVATVAVARDQAGLLAVVAGPIEALVTAELRLFGREPSGAYLFLFCRAPVQGFAGSPKTTSMTLAVSPAARSAAGRYVPHLIAHEFFHTWAASSLEFEDELRWVSEGITDYFAYLIGARLGLATWSEFANTLAENLKTTIESPLQLDPVALFGEFGVQVDREQRPPSLDPRMNLLDVCVVEIDPYGLADRLGIRKGDCFYRINGVGVSKAAEVQAA